MSLAVEISNRQKSEPVKAAATQKTATALLEAVLHHLQKSTPAHLNKKSLKEMKARATFSLILVSDRQIRKLNKEWMGKDKATDVLSFPLELEPPPPALPWEVGEIVISMERARAQAKSFGHSFEREFAFLFVHGVLHVLGFDHMNAADEKDMFGRQKQILNSLGITR
jgi:probable rRNA maturation factor